MNVYRKELACSDLLVYGDGFKAFFTKRRKDPNLQNGQLGIVTKYA